MAPSGDDAAEPRGCEHDIGWQRSIAELRLHRMRAGGGRALGQETLQV